MKRMKGQGATEYLLILVAVLVVVAVAVYYVTVAPTIVVTAHIKQDNTVWLRGSSGCSTVTSWTFQYRKSGESTWNNGSGSIGPGEEIQLTALKGLVSLGDTVLIKYDTTVKDLTVQQY